MAVYTNKTEEKNDTSFSKVIIVFIVLILFFCVGFVVGLYLIPSEPEQEEILDVEVNYDPTDSQITELISRLIAGTDCWSIEDYTNDHVVTVKDISNERIYQVTELASFYSKGIESMSIEDFDSEIQNYFSIGYSFDPEKIDYQGVGCFQYQYDPLTTKFQKMETACGGVCGPNRTQYVISRAVESGLMLKVYVNVLFGSQSESVKFYSDYERLNFVTDDYENIDQYLLQGNEYVFTFEKVNDQYLFVSSELV